MNDQANFDLESIRNIQTMASDRAMRELSQEWINEAAKHRYVYNWKWMGLPIIQLPADIVATQEVIWAVKPTVIVETGVARGGSIVFNASQLALLDFCDGTGASPTGSSRKCIGIDIDIRSHNRAAIESHPLAPMITLYEGSSVDDETFRFVRDLITPDDRVMVILDSNHTHDHVIRELELYSQLVTRGSFLIVHDTGIEGAAEEFFQDRDWGKENNPMTAVRVFLQANAEFSEEPSVGDKLLITSSPAGYLRRHG